MADDLGIEVVERGEHPDPPVLHGLHHAGVGAPEPVGRRGQDGAVVVVGRTRRLSIGREQLVLVHQPQHSVAADHQPKAIAQPRPDLAMSLASERRGREVGLDRRQQTGLRHRRRRTAACRGWATAAR